MCQYIKLSQQLLLHHKIASQASIRPCSYANCLTERLSTTGHTFQNKMSSREVKNCKSTANKPMATDLTIQTKMSVDNIPIKWEENDEILKTKVMLFWIFITFLCGTQKMFFRYWKSATTMDPIDFHCIFKNIFFCVAHKKESLFFFIFWMNYPFMVSDFSREKLIIRAASWRHTHHSP